VPRRLVLLVALVAAVALNAACSSAVSPAVKVGDRSLSNDDFLDEVGEWAGNPAAVNPSELEGQAPGTYPQALVAQVLQQRIDLELHHLEFDRLGLKVDESLRQQAILGLFGDQATADQALGGFSKAFADRYMDDVVRQNEVQAALADKYADWHNDAVRTTKIVVNSRYGSWDADTGAVVAPAGPKDPSTEPALQLGS
jgi:hypothetical protein